VPTAVKSKGENDIVLISLNLSGNVPVYLKSKFGCAEWEGMGGLPRLGTFRCSDTSIMLSLVTLVAC
jgi:hypothetical protein